MSSCETEPFWCEKRYGHLNTRRPATNRLYLTVYDWWWQGPGDAGEANDLWSQARPTGDNSPGTNSGGEPFVYWLLMCSGHVAKLRPLQSKFSIFLLASSCYWILWLSTEILEIYFFNTIHLNFFIVVDCKTFLWIYSPPYICILTFLLGCQRIYRDWSHPDLKFVFT